MHEPALTSLLRQLDTASGLIRHHLDGLGTDECLWRPASTGLHVQQEVAVALAHRHSHGR